MNGFTNAILSLLLSWIRLFINSFWKLVNSENGGHFLQFLTANWKMLLLILCIGGFVADRLIYLFRWRPYYVWLSKRRRLRREREAYAGVQPPIDEPDGASGEWDEPSDASPYAPQAPANAYAYPPMAQPTAAYQRPAQAAFPEGSAATLHYAPIAQGMQGGVSYQAPVYLPPDDLAPVFDDDLGDWNEGDTLVRPQADSLHAVSDGMAAAFGSAKPEPIDYIRDMQAGFAKPAPPEELYAQPAPQAPAPMEEEAPVSPDPRMPVHPGLDMANFRRNIGLAPAGSLLHQQVADEGSPSFRPYAETEQIHREAAQAAHPRNPFASLAKRARDFVGVTEEEDKPTIRDLQSTVDVRTAFHEPVYPKPVQRKESDQP